MRRALLRRLQEARQAKQPVALITALPGGDQALVIDGAASGGLDLSQDVLDAAAEALRLDRSRTIGLERADDGPALFIQVFNPPARLIIVGAVHIAQSLASMAALAGYAVTIVDPRRGWANEARFPDLEIIDAWPDEALTALDLDPRTAVVLLSHDPKLDDPALSVALASKVFYIGALGSQKTQTQRRARLAEQGQDEAAIARIHGPVGLDIGARSPAEIAVAILAEITQARHRPAVREAKT